MVGFAVGANGTGQTVNLSARDIWSSWLGGAANKVAAGITLTGNWIIAATSEEGTADLFPTWRPFTPVSEIYGDQGSEVAGGLMNLGASREVGAGLASLAERAAGKTFFVPSEKMDNFDDYQMAADFGLLVKTQPARTSGFRLKLEQELGPAPGPGYHADHTVELCVGGANCASTNGQWLRATPNVSAGAKIRAQLRMDSIGTVYTNVSPEPGAR
jgi:hypothetical protein